MSDLNSLFSICCCVSSDSISKSNIASLVSPISFSVSLICSKFSVISSLTSSLSPCVHSILAAKIGDDKRAYEFYLQTARLDLDDYNNEVHEGCHITSMAGTWMSFVKGFGGMRIKNDKPYFAPNIPQVLLGDVRLVI